MKTSLGGKTIAEISAPLQAANLRFDQHYPGDHGKRQPVHTVYGGAHLFKADSAHKLGAFALRHFEEFFPDFACLARVFELPGWKGFPTDKRGRQLLADRAAADPQKFRDERPDMALAATIYRRIYRKLQEEAVEDFRIDFEDGYGHRPDEEEDQEACRTAQEVALGMSQGTLPPFVGIRIKALSEELQRRSIRTLDLFITELLTKSGGRLPPNFVVTLPKVSLPEQVTALVRLFEALEQTNSLAQGSLRMELMVETPQSLIGSGGECPLPDLVQAAGGRCVGAHFGVYDYTASCGIVAAYQGIRHPACDHARHCMQVALADTGVFLSDGATNLMSVPPARAPKNGPPLSFAQQLANRHAVHRVSKINYDDIHHSLEHGFYQGWDLHPAQIPIRYAAVYNFFLESLEATTQRLAKFIDQAAQATLADEIFDDAATGQALLGFFLRGLSCGAINTEEATATGLTIEELQIRSFKAIVEKRRDSSGPGGDP